MAILGAALGFFALVGIIIVYYRLKETWRTAHPQRCGICGNTASEFTRVKNGCVCRDCWYVPYGYRKICLYHFLTTAKGKLTRIEDLRAYRDKITGIGELMRSFSPTRISPNNCIEADDRLGLFTAGSGGSDSFAHYIADIRSFRLVYDRDWTNTVSDNADLEGGHIVIRMNEPIDRLEINAPLNYHLILTKHQIRKSYEEELRFLEELTGMKRG